jgi:hypothetical protein
MRKCYLLLIVGVIAFAIAWLAFYDLAHETVMIRDGVHEVQVRVNSTKLAEILDVTCEAFGDATVPPLDDYVANSDRPFDGWGKVEKPFRGEPISVWIPFSSRVSALGRTRYNYSFRKLIVVVHYQDGERLGQMTEIPRPHEAKSVELTFP